MSALGVLSGCFPTVKGVYDGRNISGNLFVLVVAPPASGKGCLTYARQLASTYHQSRVEFSLQRQQLHQVAEQEAHRNKTAAYVPEPTPPYQTVFLPGNSSAAALIKNLFENGEWGIICETEADTLSGALSQDWGNFSDLLRKAFHHESTSYARKSGERYEMKRPALSVVLSGTPGQVRGLIANTGNGLFSRFLFYTYQTEPIWRDVSPGHGKLPLDEHFEQLSQFVLDLAQWYEGQAIQFALQPEQWTRFNETLNTWLMNQVKLEGNEAASTVFRLGMSAYRIALILSLLRAFQQNQSPQTVFCSETDFNTALSLAEVLLEHALQVAETFPRTADTQAPAFIATFRDRLPVQFQRAEADQVGTGLGMSKRNVANFLHRLQKLGQLSKLKHGHYFKP
ncbi:MAG: DUF3987 domain-containing protein [Cytophagaceae bacterium]|nr:DUF3987 domain-containing protein [Cytophagaceae bacterium]